jgi:hypothetical protein
VSPICKLPNLTDGQVSAESRGSASVPKGSMRQRDAHALEEWSESSSSVRAVSP